MKTNAGFAFISMVLVLACSSSNPRLEGSGTPTYAEPGTGVALSLSPAQAKEQSEIASALATVANLSPSDFALKYATPFGKDLGYDPSLAQGLDLIQASSIKLTDAELAAYASHGFVISDSKHFPSFAGGYQTIYGLDLPVYVSADSVLEAIHRSYDDLLEQIEQGSLIAELRSMLVGMRGTLAGAPLDQASADADVFLGTTLSLLDDITALPVRGGSTEAIAHLASLARVHQGVADIVLFGVTRPNEDFSQFTPRGHYTDTPELTRYFQAMMWLGRIDFRLLETQEDGSQIFRRRQLEAAFRLRELLDASSRQSWARIDAVIEAFVGKADYMTVSQLDSLLTDLGVGSPADLAAIPDQRIAQAIVDGGYGTQRISSHIMMNGLGDKTLPLSSSFAFMGQRYVVDSHVFSNVVFDRVPLRMMPDPLDVAFAALGNDQAGILLQGQLEQYHYAQALASMRVLVEKESDSWDENLYNLWLSADRALSPTVELVDPVKAGLSSVFTTEAWGRRLLNAQLASWAEERHDTILYAKQSYTSGVTCQFPDAYVDPYPKFFEALEKFAERGSAAVAALMLPGGELADRAERYFMNLAKALDTLRGMAEAERTGTPFDAEQMAFINQAIHAQGGCGFSGFDGWYAQLHLSTDKGAKYDPTVADVHTQPTDEGGNLVGRVLHVGTGMPRLMVVSVATCEGPRAYAGLASAYFEVITENFERLTDEVWSKRLTSEVLPDVHWMKDLIVH